MINVKYSDIETSSREPQPGPSGTQNRRVPRTPVKNRPKGKDKPISPIKFPSNTPVKNKEDVPLSKLTRKPSCVTDLRDRMSRKSRRPVVEQRVTSASYRSREERVYSSRVFTNSNTKYLGWCARARTGAIPVRGLDNQNSNDPVAPKAQDGANLHEVVPVGQKR